MFTAVIISAVTVAASVAAVVKTKSVITQIGNACPTQCIMDDQNA